MNRRRTESGRRPAFLSRTGALLTGGTLALVTAAGAQIPESLVAPYPSDVCPSCPEWTAPQLPFRIFGSTYYVGTQGLASILIASDSGHVLIDGGVPSSAPAIVENIRALGFDVADVELILNSHAHHDHAGGIAALQWASGGQVAASRSSAPVLESGRPGRDDPQYEVALTYPPSRDVRRFDDGETLRVGPIAVTAHLTPGHTPGGTTWSWRSCEAGRCLDIVYADSQTPVSADSFRFSDSREYPTALADFERSFTVLERLPCDVLITPHPAASRLWERLGNGLAGLIDPTACRSYAQNARQQLGRRLATEAGGG